MDFRVTYIGTATVLLEVGDLLLVTDPAFDPAGTQYVAAVAGIELRSSKLSNPAVGVDELGRIDAVLLSHDEHYDNLDAAGRALLSAAGMTITTPGGADRLRSGVRGLATWESVSPDGVQGAAEPVRLGSRARGLATWESLRLGGLRVTAVPARHGPEGSEPAVGHVTGFVLEWDGQRHGCVYISGDTVLFDELFEIGERFDIGTAVLHLGAGGFDSAPGLRVTLTGAEGAQLAEALGARTVIPVHYDDWTHFTEPREAARDGLGERALWLEPGQTMTVEV